VCPNFAQKIDTNGFSPLHCSCHRGNLEITRMLLKLDADLALQFNNDGYTPLHLAAMKGNTAILKEFMSMAPTSFQHHTKKGETVFHLIVRYNHCDAFFHLVHVFNDTSIFHCPDQYGNTILHIAVSGGHHQVRNENATCHNSCLCYLNRQRWSQLCVEHAFDTYEALKLCR
jgi:ankyrin repeat protein